MNADEIKVRKVVLTILKIRKYKIFSEEEFMLLDEYLTHKLDDETSKIYIYFPKTPKIGVNVVKQYIKEMKENDVKKSIIIIKDTITAFAKQIFLETPELIIEHFKEEELYVDILKHVHVPEHVLLSDEEKKSVLKIYNCKEHQLQQIKASDAVSRRFGARKGQVFKIVRNSETGGNYINYRIVV